MTILFAVTLSVTSCVMLSPEEKNVITKARMIHHYPIGRTELIETLGLDRASGERSGGGIRSGQMIFKESWTTLSGLTICAFDCEYVGPIQITSEMMDGIIDGTATIPSTRVRINAPRKSFNGFTISRGHSVLYNSRKAQEGEQGGGGNAPEPPSHPSAAPTKARATP